MDFHKNRGSEVVVIRREETPGGVCLIYTRYRRTICAYGRSGRAKNEGGERGTLA